MKIAVILGIDCHTMAATAPPVAPDPGAKRPMICLGDGNGTTCPTTWTTLMAECLAAQFDGDVCVNAPFSGGFITRTCGKLKPWLQLELSRSDALSFEQKTTRIKTALENWLAAISPR